MQQGVILYGPPASGKDTVDAALRALSDDYLHFLRVKVGAGRTAGYRMMTDSALRDLREQDTVIWENSRYDATYVVDRPGLGDALDQGTPILHLGQPDGVAAVVHATPQARWTVIELWCPRDIALARAHARGTRDVGDRLTAWDLTPRLTSADLRIDTSTVTPEEAATQIDHHRQSGQPRQ